MTAELAQASNELSVIIVDALKQELQAQGHRATGKLIDSIKYEVSQYIDRVELQFSYLDYGLNVETGRLAGKKGVPLDVLERWVILKGIASGKKARSVAFLIQRKIKAFGIPTPNSYKFSDNGRRQFFQTSVVAVKESEIISRVGSMAEIIINDLIYDMAKELNIQ